MGPGQVQHLLQARYIAAPGRQDAERAPVPSLRAVPDPVGQRGGRSHVHQHARALRIEARQRSGKIERLAYQAQQQGQALLKARYLKSSHGPALVQP